MNNDGDGPRGGLVDESGNSLKMLADDAQFMRTVSKGQPQLDTANVPEELKCPITKVLFRSAVLLPCCGASVSDDAMRHIVSSTRARASPSPRSIAIARTVEKNTPRRIRVASRRRRRRVPRARRIRILIRSRRSSRRRIESTRPREDEGDERDDRDDHATIARGDLISSRFPSRDAEGRRARDASVVDARG